MNVNKTAQQILGSYDAGLFSRIMDLDPDLEEKIRSRKTENVRLIILSDLLDYGTEPDG